MFRRRRHQYIDFRGDEMPISEVKCCDCMDFMAQFPDKYFDLAIVDPPYGLDKRLESGGGKMRNTPFKKLYREGNKWDKIPEAEYWNMLFRVSKNQIVWGGNYFHNLHLEGVIVWYKKGSGNFKEGEFAKTSINTFKVFGYSRADAYINCGDVKIHPTQKPTKLYEWLLLNYAKPNDKILDTHLGSGSIAIAIDKANTLDKKNLTFVGIELDPDYFRSAVERFKNHKRQLTIF